MKKSTQKTVFDSSNIFTKDDSQNNNIKTTNVNILLNRVRLDRKRTIKKRFIFSLILITAVSSLAVYFIL